MAYATEYEFAREPALVADPHAALFADPDGDMVPNCIEWLMLTDANQADTDHDGTGDFEEIITFTNHDPLATARPIDHDMRVLVTTTRDDVGNSQAFLHLMLRFINLRLSEIQFRDFYADLQGTRVSLLQLISGGVRVQSRYSPTEGTMFLFSLPLASEDHLRRILPCTMGATAIIAKKYVNTGCYVLDAGDEIAALMPYTNGSLALQPVSSSVYVQDGNPYYRGGGRVCEMSLEEIGPGKNGTLCEVTSAQCSPAPGLRCSISCPKKTGQIMTIPDGLGTITGR